MTPMLARPSVQADRFHLVLSVAAVRDELEAWFDMAEPGHEVVYASGLILPRAEPGVVLVTRWKDAGLVETFNRRDPADARRWQFLCRKTAAAASPAVPGPGGPPPVTARANPDVEKLLALLRALPVDERGRAECPSDGALARQMDLGRGKPGRNRVGYLMTRLARDRRIEVQGRGTCAARLVTIVEDQP